MLNPLPSPVTSYPQRGQSHQQPQHFTLLVTFSRKWEDGAHRAPAPRGKAHEAGRPGPQDGWGDSHGRHPSLDFMLSAHQGLRGKVAGGWHSTLKHRGLTAAGSAGRPWWPDASSRGLRLPAASGWQPGSPARTRPAPDGQRAFLAVSGEMVMATGSHLPSCAEGQVQSYSILCPPSCPPSFLPGPGPQHCQGTQGSAPAFLAPNRRRSSWGRAGPSAGGRRSMGLPCGSLTPHRAVLPHGFTRGARPRLLAPSPPVLRVAGLVWPPEGLAPRDPKPRSALWQEAQGSTG